MKTSRGPLRKRLASAAVVAIACVAHACSWPWPTVADASDLDVTDIADSIDLDATDLGDMIDTTNTDDIANVTDVSDVTDAAPDVEDTMSCMPADAGDPCASLPPLCAPPMIDAIVERGAASAPFTIWQASLSNVPSSVPSDIHGHYALAWRPDGLYAFVHVDVPTRMPADVLHGMPYCGDAVELFVEPDGVAGETSYGPNERHFYFQAPMLDAVAPLSICAAFDGSGMPAQPAPDTSRFEALDTSVTGTVGYSVEAFITAPDLGLTAWNLAAMQSIGVDVAVDVGDTTGGCRRGQLVAHVGPMLDGGAAVAQPYARPDALCVATLAAP